MQDALVHQIKGISYWADAARARGAKVPADINEHTIRMAFSTLTNVNFDPARFLEYSKLAETMRARAKTIAVGAGASERGAPDCANWTPSTASADALAAAGRSVGLAPRESGVDHDIFGAQEMTMYGVKGVAAYATHALELGKTSETLFSEVHRILAQLAKGSAAGDLGANLKLALDAGKANVEAMALLDQGHVGRFGSPRPTPVNHAQTAGKAILISGHDLRDLHALLEQTEGKGVNVYTHGEMLPAHGYPGLNKYKHLVGHFGGPWNLQRFEFKRFPGPIVMTTNCLIEPQKGYRDRLFTMNETGWPGITTVKDRDFSKVISVAQASEGFKDTQPRSDILTGFGHDAVLSVADKVLDAAGKGDLKRIVLIGGCDGSEGERSYYTKLATGLPQSAMILTLGCGKFRVIGKKDYGTIPNSPLPRVLDMGQCNDAYSAVVVATKLAEALKVGVNDLPLSLALSWFEQKAVAVLLSLLHLGVKGIRVGPNPPAFVTPNILNILQKGYDLKIVDPTRVEDDIKDIMRA